MVNFLDLMKNILINKDFLKIKSIQNNDFIINILCLISSFCGYIKKEKSVIEKPKYYNEIR